MRPRSSPFGQLLGTRHMPTSLLHPSVASWFSRQFSTPTAAQAQAWPAIRASEHVLIAAPTGSGKTLAAFLAAIDSLIRQGVKGALKDETQIVYVSPLKALSNDIEKNLVSPLEGIREELRRARAHWPLAIANRRSACRIGSDGPRNLRQFCWAARIACSCSSQDSGWRCSPPQNASIAHGTCGKMGSCAQKSWARRFAATESGGRRT